MKRIKIFSLLILIIPLYLTAQNQNIIDDIYYSPSNPATTQTAKTSRKELNEIKQRPNYKNGAKEIIYKERQVKYPTIIRDTVFADGKSADSYAVHSGYFDINTYDGRTNPVYLHDTIYSEGTANIENNTDNQESGHYLNGFNGTESDKEYAERIRRFHNPKYSIFIGDPRYNNIYFLNNSDWNVYVDDSYAYVTPTWSNPYWWNYSINPYGYGGWGHGWNSYGFGGMYNPWFGYDSFYGYGSMYGYANYWNPYSYSGYYGYGGYHGSYYGGLSGNKYKYYNEQTRRSTSNYSSNSNGRLGGTRLTAASSTSTVNSGGLIGSRNQYTKVSGSGSNTEATTRTSSSTGTRIVSNPANGIGMVRNTTNRSYNSDISNRNINYTSRTSTTSGNNINTSPRTYTATSNNIPTGENYTTRDNSSTGSSFRNTSPTITRSSGLTTVSPSRGNYSSGNSPSSVSRSTPTYSAPSSSSYSSGSSNSSSGSSSSGGSRSSSSSNSGGRR